MKEKERWKSIHLKGRIMNTIQAAQVHVQEMEEKRRDKRQRETEEKVTTTAEMMKQVHAHLGLGNIRDEAALAKRKMEVAKENKKIVQEEQKKRDVRALDAEQHVQEQRMSWAQRARGSTVVPSKGILESMTVDKAAPTTSATPTPLIQRKETKIILETHVAYPGPGQAWVGMKERLRGEITAAF